MLLLLCSVAILVLKDGGDVEDINDYELAPELRRLLRAMFRKQALAVLKSNGIKTAQDWHTYRNDDKLKSECGHALVGYLDELAGPPGACGARCLRGSLILPRVSGSVLLLPVGYACCLSCCRHKPTPGPFAVLMLL